MTETLFVTGATGFIGRALLPCFGAGKDRHVKALCRGPEAERKLAEAGVEAVRGDLLEPGNWRSALAGVDTVVHLAAVTGRAAPRAYERGNVAATRNLLAACAAAGVGRFLHVSTIAAGYADQSHYPYAKTKARAEALVRESGLRFCILRPTLVLGERSPIWQTLSKIARLPIIPLPRKGRPVEVQPVHVDDVVRGIELVLAESRFEGETFELGGAEPLAFSDFLSRIHRAERGRPARTVAVPLGPIRLALALVEPLLRPLMPVTAGQLAVFANDSTSAPSWLSERLRDGMPSADALIERLTAGPSGGPGAPRGGPPARPAPQSLSADDERTLRAECSIFARYLTGISPSAYVAEHYVKAAATHGVALDRELTAFDRATVRFARRRPLFARWADAYCALLRRGGPLRRKLIVLAAILEHVPPASEVFDRVPTRGAAATLLTLPIHGAGFAVSFLAGAAILIPLRLTCRDAAGAAE